MPQKLAFHHLPHWHLSTRAFVTVELLFGIPVCRVLDPIVGNISVVGTICFDLFKELCPKSYHDYCKDTATCRNFSIYNASFQYISAVCSHSVYAFTTALDCNLVCVDNINRYTLLTMHQMNNYCVLLLPTTI